MVEKLSELIKKNYFFMGIQRANNPVNDLILYKCNKCKVGVEQNNLRTHQELYHNTKLHDLVDKGIIKYNNRVCYEG